MIPILSLLASASTVAPVDQHERWHRVVSAAQTMGIASATLDRALRMPERATRQRPRLCFSDAVTDPANPRLICRSAAQWDALDVTPVLEQRQERADS